MATGDPGSTPSTDSGLSRSTDQPIFETVRRGFDPDQVLAYLERVADRVEELESQLRQTEWERAEAQRERDLARNAADRDPYTTASTRMADLLRTFDQYVEHLRGEAEAETARIRAHAGAEAERILSGAAAEAEQARMAAAIAEADARAQAEMVLQEAQSEAELIRGDLAVLHASTLNELRIMRDHMLSSISDLDRILKIFPREESSIVPDEAGNGSATGEGAPAHQIGAASEFGT